MAGALRPVTLVPVPEGHQGDWTYFSAAGPDDAERLKGLDVLERVWAQGERVHLALTLQARGHVVRDVLAGTHPADLAPAELHGPDLHPVQLVHARTAMLRRQASGHGLASTDAALLTAWDQHAHRRTETEASRRLLLRLAASHTARVRAHSQGRPAPIVANLRAVAAAFEDWYATARFTPRGPPPPPSGAIMVTYQLNLTLARACGAVIRAGLTDLDLSAPEFL